MHAKMDCLFLLLWSLQVPLVNSTSVRLLASVSFGNFIKAGDTLIINYLLYILNSLSFSKLIVVSYLQALQFCCFHSVTSLSFTGDTGGLYQGSCLYALQFMIVFLFFIIMTRQ